MTEKKAHVATSKGKKKKKNWYSVYYLRHWPQSHIIESAWHMLLPSGRKNRIGRDTFSHRENRCYLVESSLEINMSESYFLKWEDIQPLESLKSRKSALQPKLLFKMCSGGSQDTFTLSEPRWDIFLKGNTIWILSHTTNHKCTT